MNQSSPSSCELPLPGLDERRSFGEMDRQALHVGPQGRDQGCVHRCVRSEAQQLLHLILCLINVAKLIQNLLSSESA